MAKARELLDAAGRALLHKVKAAGRNRVRLAGPSGDQLIDLTKVGHPSAVTSRA